MSNIELFIGQSSTEGERKRQARSKLLKPQNTGGHLSDTCPPEIEKEIELKKNREIEKGHFAPLLGQYQNISLSETELEQLKTELPSLYQKYIDKLSEYMASTGKTYNSHIATIRKWAKEDSEKNLNNNASKNYEYDSRNSL